MPARDERERDHAHRLLRVVRAVGERHPGPGRDLAEAEAAVGHARGHPDEDPEDREKQEERRDERDRRRDEGRYRDLVREPVPLNAARP